VPDIVADSLQVVFCGINPGTLSGELAQHFARPGNRFWKVLFGAGFTDVLLEPSQQFTLPERGVGITNLVARTTSRASELSDAELRQGAERLKAFAAEWRPAWLAVLGVQAYRTAFRRPHAGIGRQSDMLSGTGLWVLPNPSGIQARYQLPEMVALFSELRQAIGR
jgi:double-stranded uracil-DNA glycosylase